MVFFSPNGTIAGGAHRIGEQGSPLPTCNAHTRSLISSGCFVSTLFGTIFDFSSTNHSAELLAALLAYKGLALEFSVPSICFCFFYAFPGAEFLVFASLHFFPALGAFFQIGPLS